MWTPPWHQSHDWLRPAAREPREPQRRCRACPQSGQGLHAPQGAQPAIEAPCHSSIPHSWKARGIIGFPQTLPSELLTQTSLWREHHCLLVPGILGLAKGTGGLADNQEAPTLPLTPDEEEGPLGRHRPSSWAAACSQVPAITCTVQGQPRGHLSSQPHRPRQDLLTSQPLLEREGV